MIFFFGTLVLTLVAGVCSPGCSRLWFRSFFFFTFLSSFLAGSAISSRDGAGFGSLALGSSERGESLWLEPWVCTLEVVLWDERWPMGQRASNSRTMVLDLKPALAFALTAFCTISSKFVDSRSYCSISTLMEGLRPSQK